MIFSMKKNISSIVILLLFCVSVSTAQNNSNKKITATIAEGIIAVGYVDNGAYVNFTGPSIKLFKKPYLLCLGVLPSLRIKEDKVPAGSPKNSIITPALGAGITFAYKHVALQVPLYYNGKTAKDDGQWNVGVGVGYKF